MAPRIGDAGHRPRVAGEPRDSVGSRIRPEVGVERAVLLHDDHDVADHVDAVTVGGASFVPVSRHLGRGEQEPAQHNRCKKNAYYPLQSGRSLRRVLES